MRATRAVIYLENLKNNIRTIRKHLKPGIKICMAVKADAYGHGAIEVSRVAFEEKVDYLGIATLREGVEIRSTGMPVPVLLLSLPVPEEIPEIVTYNILPIVADKQLIQVVAAEAEKQAKRLAVHLKVDTGMGRIGCHPAETLSLVNLINNCRSLELGGICTHFPGADSSDKQFSLEQVGIFNKVIAQVKEAGINPGLVHAANSGATIELPQSHYNMVRPGIMTYGYYPSEEQERTLPLVPVMEFKTKVVFLKRVAAGTPISYGMTYRTAGETTIATLPVGYADGYNRLLSSNAEVLIHNKRYPVAGRICMDQCMVDLGDAPDVKLYDDVTLFGPGKGGIDAEELAGRIGTIPYEITCMVGKRVPRVYVNTENAG